MTVAVGVCLTMSQVWFATMPSKYESAFSRRGHIIMGAIWLALAGLAILWKE